jgi:type II secretory pathway pseudopilin PulG
MLLLETVEPLRACLLHRSRRGRGMTLVELLVIILIIGMLVALLLPAIYAAQEAARAAQCMNNLKNLGMAALQHQTAHGSFPSGGWGWDWVGDPDRGFSISQPGGWVYNVLPFIEQKDIWAIGKGIDLRTRDADKKAALLRQITTPISMLYCPTRRTAENHPYTAPEGKINNCDLPKDRLVAKTDYAANCGDQDKVESSGGPMTLAAADDGTFRWPDTAMFTGVVFPRSRITVAGIKNGTSKALIIGEKYLDTAHYSDGKDLGDNEPATAGGDNDTLRTGCVLHPPSSDASAAERRAPHDQGFRFGSAHSQKFHGAFCDGSVHGIGYEIEATIFANLCNRGDRQSSKSDAIQ